MAAQKGRSLLIKVADAGVSPTAFTTLQGVRSRTITLNNETVDITDSDNAPWRELLEDAGLRSLSITAAGVFKDDTAMNNMEDYAFNGTRQNFQIVFGNGDTIEGDFIVSSFEYAGEFNGEQTYSVTLESATSASFVRA